VTTRPVLVAPDKFKGTLTAEEVAAAMARGLASVGIDSDICRIADGGEGTIDVVGEAVSAEISKTPVIDALGRATTGRIAVFDDGKSALVEVADAIGLGLIGEDERDALAASSFGAGELIAAAALTGARDVFVGVGGTATTDGGAGALEALRAAGLIGKRGRLKGAPRITVLCDARASWEQAALVFSPQKGADPSEVTQLAMRLDEIAEQLPQDPRGRLLTGAGGGLSGGLWAAAGAELKSGAGFVLERLDFPKRMVASRAVITGEGSLDHQTLLGKAVGEVATRARQSGVPCHAIVGRMLMTEFEARILDFESWAEAGTSDEIEYAAAALNSVLGKV
jgi:glycerate kinase